MSEQTRNGSGAPECETDTIVEEFLSRYRAEGSDEFRPAVEDDAADQLAAHEFLEELASSEAAFLEEISDVRFVG